MADEADRTTFTQFTLRQRKGLLHEELTDAMAELVAAVMKHGKKGSLTLKLSVSPHGDDGITIADAYALKAPTPPAKPSIYFADETGRFSRDRLDQPELPLRGVDGDGPRAVTIEKTRTAGEAS